MQITVKSEVIKHNLELLKDLLHRSKNKKCKAWIDASTGRICDVLPEKREKSLLWKPVHICMITDSQSLPVALVVEEDSTNADRVFHFEDWTIRARRSVLSTIHVINKQIVECQKSKHSVDFFEDFASSQIIFLPQYNQDVQHLFQDAWYDIDREGAECALKGAPQGTFLFRKDSTVVMLEEELCLRFGKPIYCVTLTYLDENGVVRDKTLVNKGEVILIYDDDPLLEGASYNTIVEAMGALETPLCHPLITSFKNAE